MVVLNCLFVARVATTKNLFSGFAWTGALAFTLGLVALMGSAFVVPKVIAKDFEADAALQKYLRDNFAPETTVLSYYPADPLRAGLAAPVTNWWHYSALIRKGVLSDSEIVSRIDHGKYGAVLLDFDLKHADSTASNKMADFYTTRSMRDAVLRGYEKKARLTLPTPEITRFTDGNLYVWVPREAQH